MSIKFFGFLGEGGVKPQKRSSTIPGFQLGWVRYGGAINQEFYYHLGSRRRFQGEGDKSRFRLLEFEAA